MSVHSPNPPSNKNGNMNLQKILKSIGCETKMHDTSSDEETVYQNNTIEAKSIVAETVVAPFPPQAT